MLYLSGVGVCSNGDRIETVGLLDMNIRSVHLHCHAAPVQLKKKQLLVGISHIIINIEYQGLINP